MDILTTIQFIILHYSALFIFLLLAYLIGSSILKTLTIPKNVSVIFVYTSFGLGVLIIILFCLAVLNILNKTTTLITLLVFSLAFILRIGFLNFFTDILNQIKSRSRFFVKNWYWTIPLLILFLPLIILPLYPPIAWDEISYHLAYAKHYVENDGLNVNIFLRYPLFAHNFDLLYSLALLFCDDVLSHLFHASAAILTALGIYSLGTITTDKKTGILAAFIFITSPLIFMLMKTSYVDLGLTLFVFLGFYCTVLWTKTNKKQWLYLAGFALGIAIGTKYLALSYLPIFAAWIIFHNKKPLTVISFFFIVLICGSFWYIRNLIIAGNPISPFGGEFFGYWIWNQSDIANQCSELFHGHGTNRNLLSMILLPYNLIFERRKFIEGMISPFMLVIFPAIFFYRKFNSFNRWLIVFIYLNIIIWFFSTQILRFLSAVFPMMALLSAFIFVSLYKYFIKKHFNLLFFNNIVFNKSIACISARKGQILILILSILIAGSVFKNKMSREPLPINKQMRDKYLSRKLEGFDLIQIANKYPELNIYQLGFENLFYFAKGKMIGDWFGPARYSQILDVANDSSKLFTTLQTLDVQLLLINKKRNPFSDILLNNFSTTTFGLFVCIYVS